MNFLKIIMMLELFLYFIPLYLFSFKFSSCFLLLFVLFKIIFFNFFIYLFSLGFSLILKITQVFLDLLIIALC